MEQKFYVLKRDGDDNEFVEVEGEMVEIGDGVVAFITNGKKPGEKMAFWRNHNWTVVDLKTGIPLSFTADTKERAIEDAKQKKKEKGERYLEQQACFVKLYGSSPAVEM